LRELVFRTVFACHSAELQTRAMVHGHVSSLSPGEIERSAAHSTRPVSIGRAWDYWVRHVERAGLMPPAAKASRKAPARAAAAKRSKPKSAKKAAPKAKGRKRR
jgi:hypothetical protein